VVTDFVYTGISDFWPNLAYSVSNVLDGIVPFRSIGSANFVQDMAELGITVISTNELALSASVILGLKQGHFNSEISSSNSYYLIGNGDGGNIEALPPSPEHPLGLLVVGTKGVLTNLTSFLERQKVQTMADGSLVRIDTSWMKVGHVDELFAVIPTADGYRVLVADLQLAIDLVEAFPSATFDFPENWPHSTTADAAYGDYIRHPEFILSVSNHLATTRSVLSSATGIPETDFIRIPVLFNPNDFAYPYVPNPVNLLAIKTGNGTRRLLIPDPLFAPMRSYIEAQLQAAGYFSEEIVWINSLESNLCCGNVHCITNPRRRIP
jgi:hypothetical protein